MIQGANTSYELAQKTAGTAYGGIAAIHAFANKIGLPKRIDQALHLFKKHLPYHQDGAAAEADHVIQLCRQAGFRRIVLRGDTAFTQTIHLDRWHDSGVKFLFGMKAYAGLVNIAENVANEQWKRLPRSPKYDPATPNRARPDNVKEQIVRRRGYDNKRLTAEWVTEVPYSPTDCQET